MVEMRYVSVTDKSKINPLYMSYPGESVAVENYYASVNSILGLSSNYNALNSAIAQNIVLNPAVRNVAEPLAGAASDIVTIPNQIALGATNAVKDVSSALETGATKVVNSAYQSIASDTNTLMTSFFGGLEKLEQNTINGLRNVATTVTKPANDAVHSIEQVGIGAAKSVNDLLQGLLIIVALAVGAFLIFSTSKSGEILSGQATPIILIIAALAGFFIAPEFFPVEAILGGMGVALATGVI
jgi:hypothetical protein